MSYPSDRSDRNSVFPIEMRHGRREILSGWKEIAGYLHMGVRTVQRYEHEFGMPIRRPASRGKGAVIAATVELDAWITAMPTRQLSHSAQPSVIHAFAFDDVRQNIEEMKLLRQETVKLRLQLKKSLNIMRDKLHVAAPDRLLHSLGSSAGVLGKTLDFNSKKKTFQ